jgi:hypothetical protein
MIELNERMGRPDDCGRSGELKYDGAVSLAAARFCGELSDVTTVPHDEVS